MDWSLVLRRNRTALGAVVSIIVALIGGREDGLLSRRVRSAALSLLRPAESALRRLIVIAARGLVAVPRARPLVATGIRPGGAAAAARIPAFRLFDPPLRFARLRPAPPRGVPRIRTFWGQAPAPRPMPSPPRTRPDPAAPVDASRLRRRLAAFERALADLPAQARRLARRLARARATPPRPLRLGRPPGWRVRGARDVDRVLRECHALALDVLADTS
jgi:hypothetical protein